MMVTHGSASACLDSFVSLPMYGDTCHWALQPRSMQHIEFEKCHHWRNTHQCSDSDAQSTSSICCTSDIRGQSCLTRSLSYSNSTHFRKREVEHNKQCLACVHALVPS